MDISPIPTKRVRISTGRSTERLQRLAYSHPYTTQVDVVFPSNDALENILSPLEAQFAVLRATLTDIISKTRTDSEINLLSSNNNGETEEEDVWCIDHCGLLTLCLSKDSYEAFGHPGTKLAFSKHLPDRYLIQFSLQEITETTTSRAKRNASIRTLDSRRPGPWKVLASYKESDVQIGQDEIQKAKCTKVPVTDVFVPIIKLSPPPKSSAELDEWTNKMESLFEWTGMASLGSQRLQVNDRVDPYIAVYEPPHPNRHGKITSLRWKGLLAPYFVQSIIDAVVKFFESYQDESMFVAITVQGHPWSPVSYIESNRTSSRYPSTTGDDTWILLLSKNVEWAQAEYIGKWDARWS